MENNTNIEKLLEFSVGFTGCTVIAGTTAIVENFKILVVNDACVVNEILDKDGINITSSVLRLTGVTLNPGATITPPKNNWFSSVKLTSGNMIGYYI